MRRLPLALIALLLCLLNVSNNLAVFTVSFVYSQFTQPAIAIATDQAYTGFQAVIRIGITFNQSASSTDFIQVGFSNSSEFSTQKSIDIKIFKDKTFQVWLCNGKTMEFYQIAAGSYTNEIVVTYYNGLLSVGNSTDPAKYLKNFGIGSWTGGLKYVMAYASKARGVAAAGSVTVEIDPSVLQATNILNQIMPALVIAISLGIVFAAIDKIMKKIKL